jgi:hypothetical protein
MSTNNAGVWIDHRQAVIVVVTPRAEHTVVIASKVEKHPERAGDSPLKGRYESRRVPADDSRQRALTAELNIYYDAVVAVLRNAKSLIVFGPGEAKGELKKRLLKKRLGGRISAIEPADKMTDRQIAARVRAHFSAPWRARGPKHGRANAGLQRRIQRVAA